VEEPLRGCEGVVAVALEVDRVEDHVEPTFEMDSGAAWHWTDREAESRDRTVREALVALAAELDGSGSL
jgi:hypothetical protein